MMRHRPNVELVETRTATPAPTWRVSAIIQEYWEYVADILVIISVLVVFLVTETLQPVTPFLLTGNLYKYDRPLEGQSIEPWLIPLISVLLPIVCFCVCKAIFGTSYKQMYRLVLALVISVLSTGVLTNFIKVIVARPRPNFLACCWPDGVIVWKNGGVNGGYPNCTSPPNTCMDHLKSFPSSHASIGAAGLGFLTFFLLGQTRTYAGKASTWRFLVCIIPAMGAVMIALSRLIDFWQHPSDIIAGLLMGFAIAFMAYRLLYSCFSHPECNVPMLERYETRATRSDEREGEPQGGSPVQPN